MTVDDQENDSAISDVESESGSSSLTPWIKDYPEHHGRTYHAYRAGSYPLPNDPMEQQRLNELHSIFLRLLKGALHMAPLPYGSLKVLDIGTGTGKWAIDFADKYKSSSVLGNDLSPIQPTWVPPNLEFEVDDAESRWLYTPNEHFHYIHVRELGGSIADWNRFLHQAYKNLRPGGWVEFQEHGEWFESEENIPKSIGQWQELCLTAAKKHGKQLSVAGSLKQRMTNAGFVNVVEHKLHAPIGVWPEDAEMRNIGEAHIQHMSLVMESYNAGYIQRLLGWSKEEAEVLRSKALNELKDPTLRLSTSFHFVYGQKPTACDLNSAVILEVSHAGS